MTHIDDVIDCGGPFIGDEAVTVSADAGRRWN